MTGDESIKLTTEYLNGSPRTVFGPEADAFLEKLKKEVEAAIQSGMAIDIPSDFEVDDS